MCPPRALPYALTRRAGAQLVACVVATLLLPLLQLALSLRGERGRDTPATRSAASREALPPWKGLPRYATVLPRRRPEPEPGCQGWRVGGGHAPSSEDDADLDAGPSPPLKMEDCYLPLDREPGVRGASRKPQHAPQRHKPKSANGWGPGGCCAALTRHGRAGTCICSGTRVDVDLLALRSARGRRNTGALRQGTRLLRLARARPHLTRRALRPRSGAAAVRHAVPQGLGGGRVSGGERGEA